MASWLLSLCAISPFALAGYLYWRGLHTAQRLLPRERRASGNNRVVPDLYSPETSHRWLGIVLCEETRSYSRKLRRSLLLARIGLACLPITFVMSAVLFGLLPQDKPDPQIPTASVTLPR
jgi:hypothetical protein